MENKAIINNRLRQLSAKEVNSLRLIPYYHFLFKSKAFNFYITGCD